MMNDLNIIFYLSVPFYLFQIHFLMKVYFEVMTKRREASRLLLVHYCELACFFVLIAWEMELSRLRGLPLNDFDLAENYSEDQRMVVSKIRQVQEFKVYFQFIISALVMFTWTKFLLMFRVTKAFGPLFKMIYQMTVELGKFLVFWFIMILIFACVSMMIFSHNETFHDLWTSFLYYLSAALGGYDFSVYTVEVEAEASKVAKENAKSLEEFGILFLIVYLFVNLIIMLNMVIAILAEVFSLFNEQQVGLY